MKINLSKVIFNSLVSIYEEKQNRKITRDEAIELQKTYDEIVNSETFLSGDMTPNKEIKAIQLQEKIENFSSAIRIVVVCYVECLNEPFRYILKKNLELIREYHSKVQSVVNDEIYSAIVDHAYKDMFEGRLPILENIQQHKDFFNMYTTDPAVISLTPIIERINPKYYDDILDEEWFKL